MPINDFVKTAVQGSFVLSDGTTELTSTFDLGDVAVSGLSGPALNEVSDFETRGRYISSSYGARRYPQITFTVYQTSESAVAPGSVRAFLMRQTPYANLVSRLGAGRPHAVKFTLNIEGTEFGDDADWSSAFDKCIPVDTSFGEAMDGNKWSFTLSCKGAVAGSIAADQVSDL